MKILIQSAVAVAAVCLLAGCDTTGFSPHETPMVSYPNYILSLETGPTNTPPRIVTPIRLAVAQIGEDAPPEALLDKLAGQKTLVASVNGLPLPDDNQYPNDNQYPYVYRMPGGQWANGPMGRSRPGPDYASRVKAICGLAQAAGADYVFIVGGNLDSWQQNNSLTLLDATIVGAAIVPAAKIHVEGRGAGVLISTATCRPVLFVSADTRTTGMSPDFLVDGKTAALDARVRDQLAAKLTDEFLNQLSACAIH